MANFIPTPQEYAKTKAGVSKEIKVAIKAIVKKSKSEAHVETTRLQQSIRGVIDYNGVPTFTEMFYGQFYNNSRLEENIKEMMPPGVAWKLIYQDEDGNPYQVVRKTASGRAAVETKATKKTTPRSLGINGIRNFLKGLTNKKPPTDGEA